jgi:hypothetical protein
VRASSTDGSYSTEVFTIHVLDINEPPVANPNSYFMENSDTLTVLAPGLLSNDSDVDGDTLVTVLVAGPSNGALALNSDGSFTYRTNAGFAGTDSFSYRTSDGTEVSNVATVTVTASGWAPMPVEPSRSEPQPPVVVERVQDVSTDEETSRTEDSEGEADLPHIAGMPISTFAGEAESRAQEGQTQDMAAFAEEVHDMAPSSSEIFAYFNYFTERGGSADDRARLGTGRAAGSHYIHSAHTLSDASGDAVERLLHTGALWQDMDRMRDEVKHNADISAVVAESALVTSTGLTVGYVLWSVRSGLFLTSLLAQVPAWKLVDPLVVLNYTSDNNSSGEDDDETLESIISKSQPKADANPKNSQESQPGEVASYGTHQ